MDKQEKVLDEIGHLVAAINSLVEVLDTSKEVQDNDIDMSPEPLPDAALSEMYPETAITTTALAHQEIYLDYEIDRCSGLLKVRNRYNQWITVNRGQWKVIDVAIDSNGWWYWKCGSDNLESRGEPNYRQRVKRLKVFHSTNGRKITWYCYDLLPV